jgi:outer membrane protein assembly factor BamB
VWSGIAYDPDLNRLYVSTGNPPQPVDNGLPTPSGWTGTRQLPQPYTYSILVLDATAGTLLHTYTPTQDTCYRASDTDIDFGGSPILYTQDGNKRVAVANKNGSLFVLDQDLNLVAHEQMLPYDTSGNQIPTVDPHPIDQSLTPLTPSNAESNATPGENYAGPFGAPAVDPVNGRLFVGLGGPNYHNPSPGLDYQSTPFMRAVDWSTLQDPSKTNPAQWPLAPFTFATPQGNVTVNRYAPSPTPPVAPALGMAGDVMFRTVGEGCVGSPMVVNGAVFVGTQGVTLYAFDSVTGQALYKNRFGQQTLGMNGGYGYCMGAASDGTYVVAGALIYGLDGGMLRIYGLPASQQAG